MEKITIKSKSLKTILLRVSNLKSEGWNEKGKLRKRFGKYVIKLEKPN